MGDEESLVHDSASEGERGQDDNREGSESTNTSSEDPVAGAVLAETMVSAEPDYWVQSRLPDDTV